MFLQLHKTSPQFWLADLLLLLYTDFTMLFSLSYLFGFSPTAGSSHILAMEEFGYHIRNAFVPFMENLNFTGLRAFL